MLKRDMSHLQASMAQAEIAHATINLISSPDADVMHEALALCVSLVDGGNRGVQDELLKRFKVTKSETFFEELSWRIKQGIAKLTEVYNDYAHLSRSYSIISCLLGENA
jgi:hypothetical protein